MPKCKNKTIDCKSKGLSATRKCSPYFDTRNDTKGSTIPLSPNCKIQPFQRIQKNFDFFNQECLKLAKELLGHLLIHKVNGKRLSGYIVETECYLGKEDAASHSYKGKRTPRNEPMFMKSGTSYAYSIYGMYHCFNISSKEEGSCVLIRALEPFEGLEQMHIHRQERRKVESKRLKETELCNGPSKLCQSLHITKETCNMVNMSNSEELWIEDGVAVQSENIVISKRIGIESAGEEWASKPLRFYTLGNANVSVRDKIAEERMKAFPIDNR